MRNMRVCAPSWFSRFTQQSPFARAFTKNSRRNGDPNARSGLLSASGTSATLKRRGPMSACGLSSDVSVKVLNSTEGAHIESMSTFEADEHLLEPRSPNAEAGTTSEGSVKLMRTSQRSARSGLRQAAS